jgi:hypothetical protein
MNILPIVLSAIIAFAATLSAGIFIKKFKNNIELFVHYQQVFL